MNAYTNTRIEFHILQSFPVTCLNRDDVGAPKTAIVGGLTRARVSSQCWKRQVRMALHYFPVITGYRTLQLDTLVADACKKLGATDEQAKACGQVFKNAFLKDKTSKNSAKKLKKADLLEFETDDSPEQDEDEKNKTLLFFSPGEIQRIAQAFKVLDFKHDQFFAGVSAQDKQAGKVAALLGYDKKDRQVMDALDIALFGRMVAKAAEMNIEGAASFSHAISTHAVSNEIDFFTALDDLKDEPGSAHMGSLEFNSATYYRYISLDLGQLIQTLGEGADLTVAVDAFTRALFMAVPAARQATQSGASPWDFARVLVRKGQRLQVPFETAVKRQDGGFQQPSIEALRGYLDTRKKQFGSMFGEQGCYEWGLDPDYSIDDLVRDLQSHVQPE